MNKIAVIPVRAGSKRIKKKNYKSFNSNLEGIIVAPLKGKFKL